MKITDLSGRLKQLNRAHDKKVRREINRLRRTIHDGKRLRILVCCHDSENRPFHRVKKSAHAVCTDIEKGLSRCLKNRRLRSLRRPHSHLHVTAYIIMRRDFRIPDSYMTDRGTGERGETFFEEWYGLEPIDALFDTITTESVVHLHYKNHDDCHVNARE